MSFACTHDILYMHESLRGANFFFLSIIEVLMKRYCSKELTYIGLLCFFFFFKKEINLASIMYTTQSYFADMQHKLVPDHYCMQWEKKIYLSLILLLISYPSV